MSDPFVFSITDYYELCNDYCGICLDCGEIADGVEPDAQNYNCGFCGANRVVGLEWALISGDISIGE
jgi:hypothetical protein